jgi:hypothetical protein
VRVIVVCSRGGDREERLDFRQFEEIRKVDVNY